MPHAVLSALPVELVLDDGGRLRIRSVRPEDKALLREGLKQLSPRSTYQRFFTSAIAFSDEHLEYLTDIDGVDHVALGALDVTSGEERGVGVARYVRLEPSSPVAEAAVAVLDAYQGRGIGSLLLAMLGRCAADNGVDVFRAYLLEENRRFLRYLLALGATRTTSDAGVVQIDLPVYRTLEAIPDTPEAQTARWAWQRIDAALAAS